MAIDIIQRLLPGARRWTVVVAALMASGGCGSMGDDPQAVPSPPPCLDDPSTEVDLGAPWWGSHEPARLAVDGNRLYVQAVEWPDPSLLEDGLEEFGLGNSPALKLGDATVGLPDVDRSFSQLTDVEHEASVEEDRVTSLDLPPGDYWLLTSNWVRLRAFACRPGVVSAVTPAHRPSGP
ncbi:hypothetical protein [Salsipaludibacter albus]|uniref:hypothetical protein n=1 Tax=Salsipaludibacter albus TaxID=2849650 RepID=UPI001EE4D064|nr:hypothetical protein [Salsipaludibacter albus]MBY5162932.1 hypothetical protein [Salsipaludibacter albus]